MYEAEVKEIQEFLDNLKLRQRKTVERKIRAGEIKYDKNKKGFVYADAGADGGRDYVIGDGDEDDLEDEDKEEGGGNSDDDHDSDDQSDGLDVPESDM